jgi:UDP-xylose:glucoside alpha-1,3-xylosyltransferase
MTYSIVILQSLLTDVDSLLYVDTDILFLRGLEEIWRFFEDFNSTQLAALAPEHEDAAIGWYNRFARRKRKYKLLSIKVD